MADIGSILRDTRIRKKIDIGTVETATKIRAKYLRAIENEEWAVLPGPTYVKSFVRTYAEFLGLDPYPLIEAFNARFEEPEELELPAFTRDKPIQRQVNRMGRPSRTVIGLIVAALFVVFLFVLGSQGKDDGGKKNTATPIETTPTPKPSARSDGQSNSSRPSNAKVVKLELVPSEQVWACVVDANGRKRVNGVVLDAGDKQGPFRSKSFTVTVGNGGGDMIINGKRKNVPATAEPIGYSVTPAKVKVLPAAKRPTCGG